LIGNLNAPNFDIGRGLPLQKGYFYIQLK